MTCQEGFWLYSGILVTNLDPSREETASLENENKKVHLIGPQRTCFCNENAFIGALKDPWSRHIVVPQTQAHEARV